MQLVVVSGKGGTGKTTIASSLAYLGDSKIMKIDCDVDASNLHLMFEGKDLQSNNFKGAKVAKVDKNLCVGCNKCINVCRYSAIDSFDGYVQVNPLKCEGCGACLLVCDKSAIILEDEVTGKTMITESKKGFISRAEMIAGAEGSGKLVTQVRKNAVNYINNKNANYIIDASPGIGCAVMASVTGCEYGLIVTEPTMSGFEDFKRISELLNHFNIEMFAVINKYDINIEMASKIEQFCNESKIKVVGKIPFDSYVEKAINEGRPVVFYENSIAGIEIKNIWEKISELIGGM